MKQFKLVSCAFLCLILLAMGLIYFLPGFGLYIVRSDSMQDVFKTGDAIITAPAGFLGRHIEPGAIITFNVSGETVSHRVVQVNPDYVVTKGDSNETPDAHTIPTSSIAGVYFLTIPGAGYAVAFIHTPIGWLLAVVVPGLLLLGLIIKDIFKEARSVSEDDLV